MTNLTDQAAHRNRHAWDSFRRQRNEGIAAQRRDIAADLLKGHSYLLPQNLSLAGDVSGKRLLDLGCGDGAEMLEWARLGAQVTGMDNSPRQLEAAQRNAATLGLSCRLVLADLLRPPQEVVAGQFDLVFSARVTAWIGDLAGWFSNVCAALRPGGVFLLNGGHPCSRDDDDQRVSYFAEGPFTFSSQPGEKEDSWNPAGDKLTTIEWAHTLGSLITAVAHAGLRITHLVELPDPEQRAPQWLPGLFIVRAIKD